MYRKGGERGENKRKERERDNKRDEWAHGFENCDEKVKRIYSFMLFT